MLKMDKNAEILRGWPAGQALDRAETIRSGVTVSNGDWVIKHSDGTVKFADTDSTLNGLVGLVVQGNGDSQSSAYSNKATVLWGNFIAQIKNIGAINFNPGSPITIKSTLSNTVFLAIGTVGVDPIIGHVLDTYDVPGNPEASVVIKIN